MRRFLFLSLMLLAGCGEAVDGNQFARDVSDERPVARSDTSEAVPVRIGELGPSFPACNATGVARNRPEGATLPVRAAPFDTAEETARVAAGARFSVCSRSHDQKWLGIVFDGGSGQGAAARDCGVSAPVPSRRAYGGPCRSGWVSSPFVKLVAGAKLAQTVDSQAENGLESTEYPQPK